MFKTLLLALMAVFSLLCGTVQEELGNLPPRSDYLDSTSPLAKIRLKRGEAILATLVPHPEKYALILSNTYTLGAEALPAHVLSDKPTIIVYQGLLSPDRSNEEIAFVLAHELGHLELNHHDAMSREMDKVFNGHPIKISGVTFSIYFQKMQEREADLYGLKVYKRAHYDLRFFPYTLSLIKINPNIHFGSSNPLRKELSSLSINNSHFGIKDRFELLTKEANS